MKVTDLMINDWVKIIHHHTPKPLITVKKVDLKDFQDALLQIYPEITYEPIPLTSEILEKNGFKKNNFNQYVLGKSDLGEEIYYEIGFIQLRYPNSYYSILSCGYVHEFQHMLKIFGIEKDIVL